MNIYKYFITTACKVQYIFPKNIDIFIYFRIQSYVVLIMQNHHKTIVQNAQFGKSDTNPLTKKLICVIITTQKQTNFD